SIHPYPGLDLARFGDPDPSGVALVARTEQLVAAADKRLYVGEYGELNAGSVTCGAEQVVCGGDPARSGSRRILDAIVTDGIAYSGLWAFEAYGNSDCP